MNNNNTANTMLTEKEAFQNGLHDFNSIESLKTYLNERVFKAYPDYKPYGISIMRDVEKGQKEGKDLVSILQNAQNEISRLVNRNRLCYW